MNKNLLTNAGLLFLRVIISILMITHGVPKLEMLLSGNAHLFPNPIGIGSALSLILVTGAEFFCSIILIIGFKSRLFVLPLIFDMLVAAFVAHAGSSFQKKELAIIYLVVYISIALMGEGEFSLDGFIQKQKDKRKGRTGNNALIRE
jgi:putative oxidoreductase